MNVHPLSEDLSKLSDEQLNRKYTELLGRYNIARRMNLQQGIIFQLNLLLEGIENERFQRLDVIPEDEDPVVIDTDRLPSTSLTTISTTKPKKI